MGGAHSASLGYYRPSHHRSAHCAACSWRLHYCRGRAFNAGEHSARLSLVVLLLLLSRMTVHRSPRTTWICCMYATQLWCCQSNTVSTTESRIPHTLWQILSLERYVPTDNRLWVQGYTSCFHSIYVKWIESAGARVVPIRYNAPDSELSDTSQAQLTDFYLPVGTSRSSTPTRSTCMQPDSFSTTRLTHPTGCLFGERAWGSKHCRSSSLALQMFWNQESSRASTRK